MISAIRPKPDPRVKHVEVDDSFVTFHLRDGRRVAMPIWWAPILHAATPKERQNFEILPSGYGVHWPDIDEDLSGIGALTGSPAPRKVRYPKGDKWTGQDVHDLRDALLLTKAAFADMIDVRRASVSDWERGVREVSSGSAKILDQMALEYEMDLIRGDMESLETEMPNGLQADLDRGRERLEEGLNQRAIEEARKEGIATALERVARELGVSALCTAP